MPEESEKGFIDLMHSMGMNPERMPKVGRRVMKCEWTPGALQALREMVDSGKALEQALLDELKIKGGENQ